MREGKSVELKISCEFEHDYYMSRAAGLFIARAR